MLTDEYRLMMECEIISATPIPLQIGVIRYIVTMPPLIFWPKTIWSHSSGMPNVKDKIRNWTRKFAVNGIALKPFVILLSVNCITAEVHGEDREARNVEQAERAEQAADWST